MDDDSGVVIELEGKGGTLTSSDGIQTTITEWRIEDSELHLVCEDGRKLVGVGDVWLMEYVSSDMVESGESVQITVGERDDDKLY